MERPEVAKITHNLKKAYLHRNLKSKLPFHVRVMSYN